MQNLRFKDVVARASEPGEENVPTQEFANE
jgi:hypothetical protein